MSSYCEQGLRLYHRTSRPQTGVNRSLKNFGGIRFYFLHTRPPTPSLRLYRITTSVLCSIVSLLSFAPALRVWRTSGNLREFITDIFFVNESTLYTSVRIPDSLSSSPAPLTAICQLFSRVQDAMRCLDTHTGEFVDINPECTNYAILSHTWDEGGEQTYTELREIQKRYDTRGQHRQRAAISLQPLPSSLDASPSSSRRSSFKQQFLLASALTVPRPF